jgi:hypothetical protein
MSYHQQQVLEWLHCTPDEANMVVDIMGRDVFHSTLDWQTEAQLRKGAKQAWALLQANRAEYEEYYRKTREIFGRVQWEKRLEEDSAPSSNEADGVW